MNYNLSRQFIHRIFKRFRHLFALHLKTNKPTVGVYRSFLLLEILIALSLMGMLLGFLFSFLVGNMQMEAKIKTLRKHVIERQYTHLRLQDFLTAIDIVSDTCPIFTSYDSEKKGAILSFYFDHGADPNPLFGGFLEGRLYLDEAKNLTLLYGPIPLDDVWRKEILLFAVQDLQFQFLQCEFIENPSSCPLEKRWASVWPKSSSNIPSMIRMIVKREEGDLHFAFRCPEFVPNILKKKAV